ncbi:conserved hypothetical protein [Histoplasma capsulatum G186AR]|uniref:G domain-containing protein n=1 Tax=Ajellomyces capsulatus (strain G186AR / H82 / ATCC MYA-2454 / RMSCC 2432) TaxID=447093 RepID=C0NBU2_AJECG|nr:uncharacterized protein HCBG_00588 [Histoplasma capsulatum G186AR]EEH11133.1 conserved hypothetical protein [Histoplasma capsulatum G186AR]
MSVLNSHEPPPPPYSFVGSSRLSSPAPSVRRSPPPYHHSPLSSQEWLSNNPPSGAPQNSRPPRLPQPPLHHSQNLSQNESTNLALRQRQEEARPCPNCIVIPIMGLTGSGKSTFISLLADGPGTNTIEIYPYQINQATRVALVDIPSFNNASRSDITTLSSIANFLCQIYSNDIKLGGIIYLHDIIARRMDSHALHSLRMFKKLCGAEGLSNAIMITNMWEILPTFEEGVSRERELRDRYWSGILGHGGMMMRHDGSRSSAKEIIKTCFRYNQHLIAPLDIQREMVTHDQQLSETAAGRELYSAIREKRQRYASELTTLREELDKALRRKDFEYGQELEEMKAHLHRKIGLVEESGRMLRGDIQRLNGEVHARREGGEKRKKKKYLGRTALGIGVATILGLTTGIFI